MSALRFPPVRRPDVSIVIVTYNTGEILGQTLQALLENTEPCYELIVVDNGSDDGTPSYLQQIENVRIVINPKNYGFGVGSNQAAARARASCLAFLNQDVFVHPGWLAPLVEQIEADEQVGAVGPMLLNQDGSLQCAGALLSRSGSTSCYGEGDRPSRPEYASARVVDFLAGACLLVRRRAFNDVGGFDPAYGLAYFEDADLCLALAARGYRSVYEPASSVTHLRGKPRADLLNLALRNRALFERRWRRVLAARPLSPLAASPWRMSAARDAPDLAASLDSLPV